MAPQNAALVNFAAGETSPKSRGRFDLPWYNSSCEKMLNFVPDIQGPARFRSGFKYVRETKSGLVARLAPFHINENQRFMLEFTNGNMRVFQNEDVHYGASVMTVTGVSAADPGVVTGASTASITDGADYIIIGMTGMEQLEARIVRAANKTGTTFELTDPSTGSNIDTSAYTAWSSGGEVHAITDVVSPYLTSDLGKIQFTTAHDGAMYIAHPSYAPYQLTVDSNNKFTLGTYTRTADPFTSFTPALNITGITLGTETLVDFTADEVIFDGDHAFAAVGGTNQLNGNTYRVERVTGKAVPALAVPRGKLKNADGTDVDSSAFGAFTTGGTATPSADRPIAPAFYEGRLGYFGTNQRANTIFLSQPWNPANGQTRYEDYTGGTVADDAAFFTLAPTSGREDVVAWARGTVRYLYVGTHGGPFRISGGGVDTPITPTSINVRQIDLYGCEPTMAAGGESVFYIQRGGTTIRVIKESQALGEPESFDLLLNADQIASSPLKRLVVQLGRPDTLWVIRDDGILAGVTTERSESVTGWYRQKIAGTSAKVLDVQVLSRINGAEQLWAVSERVVNGTTKRSVEIQTDPVVFPDFEDFYTDESTKAADLATFRNVLYRRQEEYIHLDGAATYNGTDRGAIAKATLTPGALTGTGITFTASAAVFVAGDVGNELWLKPDRETGVGGGRATITAFGSSTSVTATITVDFTSTDAIAAGAWHIAADVITGLWYLEGERVAVVTDGSVYSDGNTSAFPTVTVSGGQITLDNPAGAVHVGLLYEGFVKTQNLEVGGQTGPANAKPRNIVEMNIRFLNTLGVDFGTDLYDLEQISYREDGMLMDRPVPVFSGIKKLHHSDSWSGAKQKHVFIAQKLPLPCIVESLDLTVETGDE